MKHRMRDGGEPAAGPSWLDRVRHRARSSRGATMVEAAFVTPVFFVLLFGVMELGLTMNDYLGLANTVRAGSRVASASGNDLYADYGILQRIQRESTALPRSSIELIVVYKASGLGAAPTATCQAGNPVAGVCNVYDTSDFTKTKGQFGCLTTETLDKSWCPTARKVTLTGSGPDYVGVWMKVRHATITQMFVSAQTLTDQSVIQLEPRKKL